jgi:hypothetical protein
MAVVVFLAFQRDTYCQWQGFAIAIWQKQPDSAMYSQDSIAPEVGQAWWSRAEDSGNDGICGHSENDNRRTRWGMEDMGNNKAKYVARHWKDYGRKFDDSTPQGHTARTIQQADGHVTRFKIMKGWIFCRRLLATLSSLRQDAAIAYMVFEGGLSFRLHVYSFVAADGLFDVTIKRHRTLSGLLALSYSY